MSTVPQNVDRVKQMLRILYHLRWGSTDAVPWMVPVFDRRIVQVRAALARIDPDEGREFLQKQERRRMLRVVLRTPSVLWTLVGAQMRFRERQRRRRGAAARHKLVAFRETGRLYFELFVMVAECVLAEDACISFN